MENCDLTLLKSVSRSLNLECKQEKGTKRLSVKMMANVQYMENTVLLGKTVLNLVH